MTRTQRQNLISTFRITMSKVWLYGILVLLAIIFILPFCWALGSSLRPNEEIFRYVFPVGWKTFIPQEFTLDGYRQIFIEDGFGRALYNTLYVSTITMLSGLFVNSLAAYGFARYKFYGKSFLFGMVLITFMVPFEVIALPLYLTVRDFGLIDTYGGMIVPAIADALYIFLMYQFLVELPNELDEAARIDGASSFKIYWRIYLPLMVPAMLTAGLLHFMRTWDAYFWPLIVVSSPELTVVQVALNKYLTDTLVQWNRLFSASILAGLPTLFLFFSLQKYYIRGIASAGLK